MCRISGSTTAKKKTLLGQPKGKCVDDIKIDLREMYYDKGGWTEISPVAGH
jgi:hypothetical protein